MRVLVVEDHKRLAEAVAAGLRDEGMAVDVVLDGQDALDHVAMTRYDVLVLDRDLPGLHGDEVCKALAADRCPTRVLMLTAASTVADRVDGLGLGADDYLPKPFDFAELVAGSGRWAGGPTRRCPRCSTTATSPLTQPGASRSGRDAAWR
jgi:DNA-binding response OmpR family regulator